MEVVRDLARSARVFDRTVVTIGNFDGVHRGHQALFARTRAEARRLDAPFVVYTFDPHPQQILTPDRAPETLTGLPKRIRLIAAAGADVLVCEHFTMDFAHQEPEEFLDEVLVGRLRAAKIIAGYDFCFGRKCRGTPDFLLGEAERRGFEAEIFPAFLWHDDVVSSTRIRTVLKEGDVRTAAELLGRYYLVQGHVVQGDRRGRTLGFPTANLAPPDELLPARGVYAVRCETAGGVRDGVANLGMRPTFGGEHLTVEVHLLDHEGDLYGQTLGVRFVERLRDEMAFTSMDALVEQIHADVDAARAVLGAAPAVPGAGPGRAEAGDGEDEDEGETR